MRKLSFNKKLFLSAAGLVAGLLAVMALLSALGATAQQLQFEVASVKPADPNAIGPVSYRTPQISGDRVRGRSITLPDLILYAYNLRVFQMVGDTRLPSQPNKFDIDAKVEGSHSEDDVRLMFQSLLRDRFSLKTHWETKMLDGYRLTVAKGGAKLKPVSPHGIARMQYKNFPVREGKLQWMVAGDGAHLMSNAAPIRELISRLIFILNAPVVDETGLRGTYDYAFDFTPDDFSPEMETDSPTLASALKKATGLTLEKAKLPVQILVVEHVEKPTPN
ncbi:MAG: TIGR03435 family protein [Candidatus Acidiferrales bacterium]